MSTKEKNTKKGTEVIPSVPAVVYFHLTNLIVFLMIFSPAMATSVGFKFAYGV